VLMRARVCVIDLNFAVCCVLVCECEVEQQQSIGLLWVLLSINNIVLSTTKPIELYAHFTVVTRSSEEEEFAIRSIRKALLLYRDFAIWQGPLGTFFVSYMRSKYRG